MMSTYIIVADVKLYNITSGINVANSITNKSGETICIKNSLGKIIRPYLPYFLLNNIVLCLMKD